MTLLFGWQLRLFHFALLFIGLTAEAKLFRNAYLSFELPPHWDCQLEGTEWICSSKFSQKAKEAIIILAAKEVGPSDNLSSYTNYLKIPRTTEKSKGGSETSKVFQVKERKISNHPWIDGMHMSSEVSNYYTRYLATAKERIAILVTFSAHKDHYTKYSADFLKAIQSLRVVASKDLLSQRGGRDQIPTAGSETLGAPIGQALPSDMMSEQFPDEQNSLFSSNKLEILGILLLIAVFGIYGYLKLGKPKKPTKK